MITRDFGVRQGRRALAVPLRRLCLRALTTDTISTGSIAPTTSTVAPSLPDTLLQTQKPTARPPSIFRSSQTATRRRQTPSGPDHTAVDYKLSHELRHKTAHIGSVVPHTYSPSDVWRNPPGPKDVTLELLMASQAHMGHHKSLWNPANARYIYGVRQGIHIISLEQTAAHLRRAARVVEEVAYQSGLILFVGNRPGQAQIVTQAAKLAGACHLFTKWIPGTITNSDRILSSMMMQVVDEHDQPIEGFEDHIQERLPLVPDLVVVLNPMENFPLLHECGLRNVPTIGVIDTNCEPTWVTYAIPANDDSLRCLAVIGSVLGRAGETGKQRRLEEAKRGHVAWQTALDLRKAIHEKATSHTEVTKTSQEQTRMMEALQVEEADWTTTPAM